MEISILNLFRISDLVLRVCQHPFILGVGFMQNKANLQNEKMNINSYPTTNYKENLLCAGLKNKPKQTQFQTPQILPNPANLDYLVKIGSNFAERPSNSVFWPLPGLLAQLTFFIDFYP